jgi:actin-related protein
VETRRDLRGELSTSLVTEDDEVWRSVDTKSPVRSKRTDEANLSAQMSDGSCTPLSPPSPPPDESRSQGEVDHDHISRADAKTAFQRFIKMHQEDQKRYVNTADSVPEVDDEEAEVISVPAAQPLQVMNVRRVFSTALPNGTELELYVDKERFHCCEVLFQPSMSNSDERYSQENGIVNTILRAVEAIEESVRPDICSRIIVFGRTSLVPGLLSRLQVELRGRMRALGVEDFTMAGTEEPFKLPPTALGHEHEHESTSTHEYSYTTEPTLFGSRSSSFAPSAAWRGASERIKWSRFLGNLTQKVMSQDVYHSYGPEVIETFLMGIMN